MQAHGLNWLSQILLIKLKDIYGIRTKYKQTYIYTMQTFQLPP